MVIINNIWNTNRFGHPGQADKTPEEHVFVVMGVSGSGKSTIGRALAAHLGWPFLEGDEYHPEANIRKMSAGTPLGNEDRKPWIEALSTAINETEARCRIVSCSSLSVDVRGWLRQQVKAETVFIYLKADQDTISQRLEERAGHFFKGSMLDSQFAALEEPGDNENVLIVDAAQPIDAIVEAVARIIAPGTD